jgi:hypothetical protein
MHRFGLDNAHSLILSLANNTLQLLSWQVTLTAGKGGTVLADHLNPVGLCVFRERLELMHLVCTVLLGNS